MKVTINAIKKTVSIDAPIKINDLLTYLKSTLGDDYINYELELSTLDWFNSIKNVKITPLFTHPIIETHPHDNTGNPFPDIIYTTC